MSKPGGGRLFSEEFPLFRKQLVLAGDTVRLELSPDTERFACALLPGGRGAHASEEGRSSPAGSE